MRTPGLRPLPTRLAWWLAVLLLAAAGCAKEKSIFSTALDGSCLDCHTDKEALIASADPVEEPGEDPGEG